MTYSFAQALEMFPEAMPAAKRAAKAQIKELRNAVSSLADFRDIWTADIQKIHFSKQRSYIDYLNDLIERLHAGYAKEIKKYQYQLEYIENLSHPEHKPKGDPVNEVRIERAKQFPITDLLEVKRWTTLCLWHDDHKPSMKVYKDNHVYCFVCCRSADSIDVYMALNGCDFRTAVRALAP